MKFKLITTILILILALAACNGDEPAATDGDSEGSAAVVAESSDDRLNENYADALSVQAQLSIGSLQLETSDIAITEAQAETILPLWQALQALGQSETTADAELAAVLNQIQDEMNSEQIAFITDLALTQESFQEMVANGDIAFGRGGRGAGGAGGRQGGQGGGQGGRPAGGLAGGGGRGGAGGGLLGGGGGEGRPPEGGPPAGGPGGPGGPRGVGQATTGATIRMLQTKLGQEVQRGGPNGNNNQNNPNRIAAITIAEALGLTIEDYQAKFTDDSITPADVISAENGDYDAIKSALMDALADTELADSDVFEARIDTYLTGE
ncbi:MAG: hypothetical protein ACPG8W_23375 [Candidatus Promineifilaceae bacterium]